MPGVWPETDDQVKSRRQATDESKREFIMTL